MAYCFQCSSTPTSVGLSNIRDRAEISSLMQSDCKDGMFCFERHCIAHGVVEPHPSFKRTDERQYDMVQELSEQLFKGCQEEIVFEFSYHPGSVGIKCPRLFFADGCSMELFPGPLGTLCLQHGKTRAIRTGVRIAKWPQNCVGIVSNIPRNAASGVVVAHTVLDSSFPGEICVVLSNFRVDRTPVLLTGTEPIAMLTFIRAVRPLIKMRALKGLEEESMPREQIKIYRAPPPPPAQEQVESVLELSEVLDRPPTPFNRDQVLRCLENVRFLSYLLHIFSAFVCF